MKTFLIYAVSYGLLISALMLLRLEIVDYPRKPTISRADDAIAFVGRLIVALWAAWLLTGGAS